MRAYAKASSDEDVIFVAGGATGVAVSGLAAIVNIFTAEPANDRLTVNGLGDDDVLLTHTGCQFPCNQAPVVSVQPDDVWYGHVDADAASRIVAEHFVAGTPVESHRLPR